MLIERFKKELNRIVNLGYSREETIKLIRDFDDDIIINLRVHNIITKDEEEKMVDILYNVLNENDLVDLYIEKFIKGDKKHV